MGVRPDMEARRVPLQALDTGGVPFPIEFLTAFNDPTLQDAVFLVGFSFKDIRFARFYQMWLNGGELNGVRLFSPAMVDLATTIHTVTWKIASSNRCV